MKKHTARILAALLLLTVAVTAWSSTLWEGSLTAVNNTTGYSATNQVGTLTINLSTLDISDGGLTALTALGVNFQLSFDQTNFLTETNFQCPSTNAGTYPWQIGTLTIPVYARFAFVTTNNVNVGVFQP